MKKTIVGLSGKKGTGKNYVADVLKLMFAERYDPKSKGCPVRVAMMAFADPIKEYCIGVLGLGKDQVYGSDNQKNTHTQYPWIGMPQYVRDRNPGKTGYMTAREIMQVVGTELNRDVWGKDIWINALGRRAQEADTDVILVTDCRFPNEADAIRRMGGEVWSIIGPQRGDEGAKKDAHPSETEIDNVRYDRRIDNSQKGDALLREQLKEWVDNKLNPCDNYTTSMFDMFDHAEKTEIKEK